MSVMDGCGLPTWANVVVHYGQMWTPSMGRNGRSSWMDMDFQHGQTWSSIMDKVGCPMWTEVAARCWTEWAWDVDRMWVPKSAHDMMPICAHYWVPKIAPPSWASIVGLPFCGGIWSPIIGHPSAPNNWAATLAHHGYTLLGVRRGRMWAHSNGTPTSPAHTTAQVVRRGRTELTCGYACPLVLSAILLPTEVTFF